MRKLLFTFILTSVSYAMPPVPRGCGPGFEIAPRAVRNWCSVTSAPGANFRKQNNRDWGVREDRSPENVLRGYSCVAYISCYFRKAQVNVCGASPNFEFPTGQNFRIGCEEGTSAWHTDQVLFTRPPSASRSTVERDCQAAYAQVARNTQNPRQWCQAKAGEENRRYQTTQATCCTRSQPSLPEGSYRNYNCTCPNTRANLQFCLSRDPTPEEIQTFMSAYMRERGLPEQCPNGGEPYCTRTNERCTPLPQR